MNNKNNTLNTQFFASHLHKLLDETDENHRLCLPVWPMTNNSTTDFSNDCISYKVLWNTKSCELLIAKVSKLAEKLRMLAQKYNLLRADSAEVEALSPELKETWNKYVTPLNSNGVDLGSIDDEKSIEFKVFFGEELTEAESETYRKYYAAAEADAQKRIGYSTWAYDVIICAERLCHLLALDAPKLIIENEAKILTEAMLMHEYGKEQVYIKGIKEGP